LIVLKTFASHATNNGNLKEEGWTNLMMGLNETFNLNLNRKQIKNQKKGYNFGIIQKINIC